jgi:peptide/nickel transport system substrate-binding protein
MRRFRVAALATCIAIVATACSSSNSSNTADTPQGGGVLKIGTNSNIDTLNPFVAFQQDSYAVFQQMYPYLVQYDSKRQDFAPDFAQRWEQSSNDLRWTFHTTPGAKWSDGQPLTANDAAWTFNTIVKYGDGPTANLSGDFSHVKSIEATDDNTLVITYVQPVSNVLANLQQVPVLPQHVWEQFATGDGKELRTYPNTPQGDTPIVSGGPFTLVEYQKDQDTILKANPNFYGPTPLIEGFGLIYFSNEDAEIQALKIGDIDATENIPTTAVKTLQADTSLTVYRGPGISFRDFIINSSPKKTANLELQDPKVRMAMEYAIDRNQIVQTAWLGYSAPGTTIVPPTTPPWHNDQIQGLPFSIDKANTLLDQAGYPKGPDGIRTANGHPMSYEVLFAHDETGEGDRAFSIIQSGFKQIGIDIQQRKMDNTALNNAIIDPNAQYSQFDLAMWDWYPLVDPDFILAVLTCGQWGSWSDTGYCNPAYDKLYADQGLAVKAADRKKIVDQMQQMIFDDRPYIVLNYNETLNAWSNRWTGFVESVQGWFNPLSKESLEQIHQA